MPAVSNQSGRFLLPIAVIATLFVALELPQLVSETTAVTSFVSRTVFENNLSEVTPGKFYRSAEMSNAELRKTIAEKGIRTVVDLRLADDEPREDGLLERDFVPQTGAGYIHVPMVGSRLPDKGTLEELIRVYDTSPTPILVHCSSGTHRSGVASAIWLLSKSDASVETAQEQLSAKFGFFAAERALKSWVQGSPTIDQVLAQYAEAHNRSGIDFRSWVEKQ